MKKFVLSISVKGKYFLNECLSEWLWDSCTPESPHVIFAESWSIQVGSEMKMYSELHVFWYHIYCLLDMALGSFNLCKLWFPICIYCSQWFLLDLKAQLIICCLDAWLPAVGGRWAEGNLYAGVLQKPAGHIAKSALWVAGAHNSGLTGFGY